MSKLQEIVQSTIGQESLYVMDKSGSAMFKEYLDADVILAKTLLTSLAENHSKLEEKIKNEGFYSYSLLDHEFKTLYLAIDKLNEFLGTKLSEQEVLEACIFQQHISEQDDYIRAIISEADEKNS